MAGEEIPLERILQVYREESRRKGLTSLEADFWERVQAHVEGLEADLNRESAKDPNSAKAALLRDELKKVLRRREQIWQYRERKMALMACSAAAGAPADTAPLTPVEVQTFQAIMGVLERGRARAFGEAAEKPPAEPVEASSGEPEAPEAPERMAEPKAERPRTPAPDRILVRVLEDLPPFMGVEVTHRLRKEDVVSLPKEVAKVLLEKGKAERIRPRV